MKFYIPILFSLFFMFCTDSKPKENEIKTTNSIIKTNKNPEFNAYWFSGKAEITSYKLSQVRYGEIHEGKAVNIFVTEDFLPIKQVKADYQNKENIPVIKLNSTKKFTTGIYPYSLMTSTFTPIDTNKKSIKISFSAQEWCGNTFAQLNNRNDFEISFYSYFETNSDRKINLDKYPLENEFWSLLRINPKGIQTGNYKVIPSFEFLALNHKEFQAYSAEVNLVEDDGHFNFSVSYPTLQRKLTIKLTKKFPHTIESWQEIISSRGQELTTKAEKIKTIQSAYWSKNGVADVEERKILELD